MNNQKKLNQIRTRRKIRTRAGIKGTADKPRLSIFKSNSYIYVQLIDDEIGKTLMNASIAVSKKTPELLGEEIAKKAAEKGIKIAVFDRGNYKYHGIIRVVAEAARKTGLQL